VPEVAADPALRVHSLRIEVAATGDDIVDHVTLEIAPGEVLGLVGESGSGKTTVGLAILAHRRRGVRIADGSILVGGRDVLSLSAADRRDARGRIVSYVPQDPAVSLNPARRIGAQLLEALRVHGYGAVDADRRARIAETMREVLLPDDDGFQRRYPHELSGGQQQRVAIAMAFACKPAVVVLDEPTTGLDVTTQAHILDTIRTMTRAEGAAALYVTHDLAVVANLADRVAVMYAGLVVEQGPASEIFARAAHPYTRRLLAAIPRIDDARDLLGIPGRAPAPGQRPGGCPFVSRCELAIPKCSQGIPPIVAVGDRHEARCLRVQDALASVDAPRVATARGSRERHDALLDVTAVDASYGAVEVVHDISFSLERGQCVALVGESGSGKTTIARSIAGLHGEWKGTILFDGAPLSVSPRRRTVESRRRIQYVFQNPYGSLNPRRTIAQTIERPLSLLDVSGKDARIRVDEMLELVSLTAGHGRRFPDELSGGERQRVAIARALICEPELVICDEVTSALDVSVQAAIVNLLVSLQRDLGLSLLFVTHNLPLVRSLAQFVAVMRHGRIVELGSSEHVLLDPTDEYTRRLLADSPQIEAGGLGLDS
jgi:peptide/nickel transport system ATP-binding protein